MVKTEEEIRKRLNDLNRALENKVGTQTTVAAFAAALEWVLE